MDIKGKQQYLNKLHRDIQCKLERLNVKLNSKEDINNSIMNVLLIEDNVLDIELTKKHLDNTNINYNLNVLNDGQEAIKYLDRESPYSDMPIPDFIIIDLEMPRVDGRQVFRHIENNRYLHDIPTLIITGSQIVEADFQGEVKVLHKPLNLDIFKNIIYSFTRNWHIHGNFSNS